MVDGTHPQNAAVKTEALALDVHNITVLETSSGSHEGSLVQVCVELLGLTVDLLAGIKALETVLLEGIEEDMLGHVETGNKIEEVLVLFSLSSGELVRGHGQQRAVEVVDAVEEVLGETLDGELAGSVHVALVALNEIAGFGDGAEPFVLIKKMWVNIHLRKSCGATHSSEYGEIAYLELNGFLGLLFELLLDGVLSLCVLCGLSFGGFLGLC